MEGLLQVPYFFWPESAAALAKGTDNFVKGS